MIAIEYVRQSSVLVQGHEWFRSNEANKANEHTTEYGHKTKAATARKKAKFVIIPKKKQKQDLLNWFSVIIALIITFTFRTRRLAFAVIYFISFIVFSHLGLFGANNTVSYDWIGTFLITHNVSVAAITEKVECSEYCRPWPASLLCALNNEHANNNYLHHFRMFECFFLLGESHTIIDIDMDIILIDSEAVDEKQNTKWYTNRSGLNVLIWNGRYVVLLGNISGLTMLRIKINIRLKRTGIKISSKVWTGWRYWMRKFFHINRRNLSKFEAIRRPSSYGGGAAFVPMSMLLCWLCGSDDEGGACLFDVLLLLATSGFIGCVQSLGLSIDVDAVQYDDADDDGCFGLWCGWSCSSSPLSQFTCS